jgi:hypothetical protein
MTKDDQITLGSDLSLARTLKFVFLGHRLAAV